MIGVNSQIQSASGSDGNVGIGFAIPINTVKDVAAQLIAKGVVEHPFVGVGARAITSDVASALPAPGAARAARRHASVTTRAPRRPACAARRSEVTLAGSHVAARRRHHREGRRLRVASLDELRAIVADKKPGDSVELELDRKNSTLDVKVKLGRQPASLVC